MNNLVKKGASFFKEFQNFAVKGNVMDMAIGAYAVLQASVLNLL